MKLKNDIILGSAALIFHLKKVSCVVNVTGEF